MNQYHTINNLHFSGKLMIVTIDNVKKEFELSKTSKPLLDASDQERNLFEISPSGYGIHWPLLDEDLSIDGLLGIVHSPKQVKQSA